MKFVVYKKKIFLLLEKLQKKILFLQVVLQVCLCYLMLIWSNIVKTVNNKLLEPFLCLQRRFTLPTGFESYELLFYSIHTWNYKLGDSLLKINKVVTKLLNVYMARKRESHLFRPSWAACLGMCPILRAEARITTESSRNKEPKPLCECVYERERVHLPFSSTLKGLGSPALTQILSYSLIIHVRLQPFS